MQNTKRKILFVDDSPHRWEYFSEMFRRKENEHVEFEWAKNYDETISALKSGKWNIVFLDHDLEDPGDWDTKMGWRDGTAIVDWIREHTPDIGFVVCHSMNPVGRKRMSISLENGGYKNTEIPFYTFDSFVEPITALISHGSKIRIISEDDHDSDEDIRNLYGG